MKSFDQRMGSDFVARLPTEPGVYRIFDSAGKIVYVGKAKNLRKRLSQYRNAKRVKAHSKMRLIVRHAVKIETEICSSELDASLLELRLIQQLRPRFNVAGAFSFLYPSLGLELRASPRMRLVYSTRPELLDTPELNWHGTFRSRHITGEAFDALTELLRFVCPGRPQKFARRFFARAYVFDRFESSWIPALEAFLRGESNEFLELLLMALVDKPQARLRSHAIQKAFKALKRFWRVEARPLRRIICETSYSSYPVPREDVDYLKTTCRYKVAKSSQS
jgi:excinuclease ABC subunit C